MDPTNSPASGKDPLNMEKTVLVIMGTAWTIAK